MKKLKLEQLQLGELLTREQMKNVVGGDYGDAPCSNITCPPGTSLTVRQISDSAYVCCCEYGDVSYCY